jgi:hypothetical protein
MQYKSSEGRWFDVKEEKINQELAAAVFSFFVKLERHFEY